MASRFRHHICSDRKERSAAQITHVLTTMSLLQYRRCEEITLSVDRFLAATIAMNGPSEKDLRLTLLGLPANSQYTTLFCRSKESTQAS